MLDKIKVFTGNSNPALAQKICDGLGVPLGNAGVKTFSDGEVMVEVRENVRGRDVYLVQSTCAPTNNNLMELLVMMDAMKRASTATITAVIPYYGYARQDRKAAPRTPISAKLVADLLTTAGADRVVTIDLHAGQIQGFSIFPWITCLLRRLFWLTSRSVLTGKVWLWSVLMQGVPSGHGLLPSAWNARWL